MEIYEDETQDGPSVDEREEAFQAAVMDWRMQKLQPFSISRRAFFLSWRAALSLQPLSSLLVGDGLGFVEDALRLVWLCLKSDTELEDLRALGFAAMQKSCNAWADAEVKAEELQAVLLTGFKIWNNSSINRHAPDIDPDYASDTPGKS